MKKCPICQKEFPDSMRFCQTDGTPLVEEAQAEDPLKTTVVRQEDIASAIPPSDPFKTMVASSSNRDESGDLLQLPEEEFDPLKTMVAAPIGQNKPILEEPKPEAQKFEEIRQEIKSESSPFSGFSQPIEPLPETPNDFSNDPTVMQPEPPKFNEPSLNPPSFGDSSAKEEDDLQKTVMQNPWDNAPGSNQSPYSNDSPFSKPNDAPMASPFDVAAPFDEPKSSLDEPKSPFDQPQTPFGNQPSSPFDSPQSNFNPPPASSFDQPQQSTFENQPASFEPQTPKFEEPSNQFNATPSSFDQMNQGFGSNQPLQQNDWTAPPAPEQGWGDQGLGANTPFQPPVVGAGQSKTLATISIICGGISVLMLGGLIIPFVNLVCGFLSPGLGLAGVITGFLARSRANRNPDQYGGAGLALGGIITGTLSILAVVGLFVLAIVLGFMGSFSR
jgi:hypothetical protein